MAKSPEQASSEELIGFHKGALQTLANERKELTRILGIVEQLMQAHVSSLKELGVDLVAEAEKIKQTQGTDQPVKENQNSADKIEDML